MALEIEREFLIDNKRWKELPKPIGKSYKQGYLLSDELKCIRIRISDTEAFLTIKSASSGAIRHEFEYKIPLTDARQLLDEYCRSVLSKTRCEITHKNKLWEVDVFHGDNEGLIIAEIELESEDEKFDLPDWVTDEVTNDPKYYNSNLVVIPFDKWKYFN